MRLEQFEQEGKVGFKDGCKIIIPAIYESASYFHDGYAVVRLNGLSGVIDSKGEMVIPNQYDDITHLFEKYFCVRINVGVDWNCGIIDTDGNNIINPSYKVIRGKDKRYFLCYKAALSKAKDLKKYPRGEAYEYVNLENCVWCNIEGKVLTSLEVVNSFTSLIVKNEKGKLGVINQNGELIVDFIYDTIEPCTDDIFAVSITTVNGTAYNVTTGPAGDTISGHHLKTCRVTEICFVIERQYRSRKLFIQQMLVKNAVLVPQILQPDVTVFSQHLDVAVTCPARLVRQIRQTVACTSRNADNIRKLYAFLHKIVEHTAGEHPTHASSFQY